MLIAPLVEGVLSPSRGGDQRFRTHYFEHSALSDALLHTCISLLNPGDALPLFVPSYGLPFNLNPSSVNLPPLSELVLSLRLLMIRSLPSLYGKLALVIHIGSRQPRTPIRAF